MILSFLWRYFLGPIVADAKNIEVATWKGVESTVGYNIFNTFAWSLLAIMVLYGFYRLFERLEIEFDLETVLYSVPFILMGGLIRFIEDTGAIPFPVSIIAITPLIYIFIALLYLSALAISYRFRRDSIDRYIGLIGAALLIPVFVISSLRALELGFNYGFLVYSIIFPLLLTSVFYIYLRKSSFNTLLYGIAGFSQFFGGAVSMLSVIQGGTQKQLLAQYSTQIFGAPGILIVKIGIVVAALYLLKDIDDVRTEALVLLALIAIGLGTGLRVMMRASTGV